MGERGKWMTLAARARGSNPSNSIWESVRAALWATYRIGYKPLWGLGSANRLSRSGHGAVISDSRIEIIS